MFVASDRSAVRAGWRSRKIVGQRGQQAVLAPDATPPSTGPERPRFSHQIVARRRPAPSPTARSPGRTSPAPPPPAAVAIPCPCPAFPPPPTACPASRPCAGPGRHGSPELRAARRRAADRKGNRPGVASTGNRARLAWSCLPGRSPPPCRMSSRSSGSSPAAILGHLADDGRHLRRVGVQKPLAPAQRRGCLLLLDDLLSDRQARDRSHGQQDADHQPPHRMIPARLPHHLPLRRRPVLLRASASGSGTTATATAVAGSPGGRSTPPPDPPAAVRPGPAAFPSACGSASPAGSERDSRG